MRAELRALYFVSNVRRLQSLQLQIFQMSDEGRASRLNYQTFSAEKVLKTDLTITRQNILQCINSSGNSRTWALQRYLCTVKFFANLAILTQSLQGSFSAVSTPIFASKYSLGSSRGDLHDGLSTLRDITDIRDSGSISG